MLYLSLERVLLKQVSPELKKGVKKLVSVLATFIPVIGTKKKTVGTIEAVKTAKVREEDEQRQGEYPNFARVPYIRYPIIFQKKLVCVLVLFNSGSKVNTIYPTLARELGLPIRGMDIRA